MVRDQAFPAARLASAPGQFSLNFDDGNWNYDKGDPFSAVGKVTQDITLTKGDWGFFMKSLFFYDAVNVDFTEYHPNIITRDNFDEVGYRPGQPQAGALTLNAVQYGAGRAQSF